MNNASCPELFEWDVSAFVRLIKPIYEGRDSVPFLINKTKSEDPTDRILACMLLNELIDQVNRQPTPQGLTFIRGINQAELLAQLESVQTNSLAEAWSHWYAVEHEIAEKHLEPSFWRRGTPHQMSDVGH